MIEASAMHALSYIISFRAGGDPLRKANLDAVLRWLGEFEDIEVMVVEQDVAPRWSDSASPGPHVRRVPVYQPGPFNKAWGFNVGARLAQRPVLAFGDADMIAHDGLAMAAQLCRDDYDAVKPYGRMVDLDDQASERVRAGHWDFVPGISADAPRDRQAIGEHVVFAGGIFLMRRERYMAIGGFDERFVGWGGEDDAMTQRIRRHDLATAEIEDAIGLHLLHARSQQSTFGQPAYAANLALLEQSAALSDAQFERLCEVQRQVMGRPDKYGPRPA